MVLERPHDGLDTELALEDLCLVRIADEGRDVEGTRLRVLEDALEDGTTNVPYRSGTVMPTLVWIVVESVIPVAPV